MSVKTGSDQRTLRVDYLARVEGEGAMYVKISGDEVQDVKLRIYEPPRFFEAFLRGRAYTEVPDIPLTDPTRSPTGAINRWWPLGARSAELGRPPNGARYSSSALLSR